MKRERELKHERDPRKTGPVYMRIGGRERRFASLAEAEAAYMEATRPVWEEWLADVRASVERSPRRRKRPRKVAGNPPGGRR